MQPITLFLHETNDREECQVIDLKPNQRITIGSNGADILFKDPELSAKHCLLLNHKGKPIVVDNRSANGTYLNGKKIEKALVKDNDRLRFGSLEFRIVLLEDDHQPISPATIPTLPGLSSPIKSATIPDRRQETPEQLSLRGIAPQNKRVFALTLDTAIVITLFTIAPDKDPLSFLFVWILFLLGKDGIKGRSPGKLAAGLQTIRIDGTQINLVQSAIRNSIFIPVLTVFLEFFMMKRNPNRQRLGDVYAKTMVVDLKPGQSDRLFLYLAAGVLLYVFILIRSMI